jgi:phosphoglycolate phosphatase-like HAD superfamily hydrolase
VKTVKAIVFDLDGVLFEARDLHRIALDRALVQYSYPPISDQDHLSVYNGLPTKTKLKMLGIEGEGADYSYSIHLNCKEEKQS